MQRDRGSAAPSTASALACRKTGHFIVQLPPTAGGPLDLNGGPPWRDTRGNQMRMTPQERETIKRMAADGYTMMQIGKALNRVPSWVWDRVYEMRKRGEIVGRDGSISLATVSILETPSDLTNADYYAGKAALSAAGLA